jgi:hypothetical protein
LLRRLTPELRGGMLRLAGVIVVLLGVMTMLRNGGMQHEMLHDGTMPGMEQHHM